MLKTKKSKQNVTILVLSVMLAIAAIFGVTAAWFVSGVKTSGTVKTGTLAVKLKVGDKTYSPNADGSAQALTLATTANAQPGDAILGAVSVITTDNTIDTVLRIKATISATGLDEAGLTITATGWTLNADGYWYYTNGGTTLATVKSAETAFCGEVKLSETLESGAYTEGTGYKNQNVEITVTLEVEATQAKTGAVETWGIKLA